MSRSFPLPSVITRGQAQRIQVAFLRSAIRAHLMSELSRRLPHLVSLDDDLLRATMREASSAVERSFPLDATTVRVVTWQVDAALRKAIARGVLRGDLASVVAEELRE